jgi:hypothetical protein
LRLPGWWSVPSSRRGSSTDINPRTAPTLVRSRTIHRASGEPAGRIHCAGPEAGDAQPKALAPRLGGAEGAGGWRATFRRGIHDGSGMAGLNSRAVRRPWDLVMGGGLRYCGTSAPSPSSGHAGADRVKVTRGLMPVTERPSSGRPCSGSVRWSPGRCRGLEGPVGHGPALKGLSSVLAWPGCGDGGDQALVSTGARTTS